jgi:thymidine phosphorylase
LTRHDHPLGYAVGNQIEIEETIETLHGNVLPDIEELVTKYGNFIKLIMNYFQMLIFLI